MTTEEQIIEIVNSSLNRESKIEMSELSSPLRDLGIDSLDFMLILVRIQEEMSINIPEEETNKIGSLADIVKIAKSSCP